MSDCTCDPKCIFCTRFPELLNQVGNDDLFPEENTE